MMYRKEIDGLRAIAVIAVILNHANFKLFSGGFVGVDIFFVISGYLITQIIITGIDKGSFNYSEFYFRRAKRILPALFLVIITLYPFAWFWMWPGDLWELSQSLIAVPTFSSNIFFWMKSGYFDISSELKPLIHTWSLGVEEQFYIIFPLLMCIIWKKFRNQALYIISVFIIASLTLAQYGSIYAPNATFYLLPTRIWEFFIGVLTSILLLQSRDKDIYFRNNKTKYSAQIASLSGLVLILLSIFLFDKNTPYPSVYTILPTIGTALIIFFGNDTTITGKILKTKSFVYIGLISYSLYLWHQPIFALARHQSSIELSFNFVIFLILILFIFAHLSWRFVETPFRNKPNLNKEAFLLASFCISLIIMAVGFLGMKYQGFEERFDQTQSKMLIPKKNRDIYVWKKTKELTLREFDHSNLPKILIVGDSFSADLINSIYEAELDSKMNLSTFPLSSHCQNVNSISLNLSEIPDTQKKGCDDFIWNNNDIFINRVNEADYVVLASNWPYWITNLLPLSLNDLREKFGDKFIVIGAKNFGPIKLGALLKVAQEKHVNPQNPIEDIVFDTNHRLRQNLSEVKFIDSIALLCGTTKTCSLFTNNWELISYDGYHLTPEGARFYGEKLRDTNIFNSVLLKNVHLN